MGSLRCYHKSQIWEPTTVPFFSSPLVNIRSSYTLVPDDKVDAAMKKSFWEIYSRNLSSKISLPISYPAPILHKKKIISVRSLLLCGSVHFLMTWGLGLGSNRRCYYQRFLSSTLVSKSSKTFLEKPSVDSANTLSKHMCTSCTAHPPEASFCEPQNFSLPQLLQCWNASTFVLVTVWVFVFAPSSHWNLFTPFGADWECSATPMLIQVILILN